MHSRKTDLISIGIYIVIFIVAAFRGYFVDEAIAFRTLQAQGYNKITIVSHTWFLVGLHGCDMSDAAKFTAHVTTVAGEQTSVIVCSGLFFKGATVRVR